MLEQALGRGHRGDCEHQRLEKSFAALNDQFEAANEALVALGRSAGDPNTVLTTIVESARRLCPSQAVHLYLLEEGLSAHQERGMSRKTVDYIAEHPMPMDRDTPRRASGPRPHDTADYRRPRGPRLRAQRSSTGGPLPAPPRPHPGDR